MFTVSLQALAGLSVSRILKYADAVLPGLTGGGQSPLEPEGKRRNHRFLHSQLVLSENSIYIYSTSKLWKTAKLKRIFRKHLETILYVFPIDSSFNPGFHPQTAVDHWAPADDPLVGRGYPGHSLA